jgi:hypothetical protein
VEQDVETGTCSQTDVGMDLIGSMESEMQRLLEESNKLKNICSAYLELRAEGGGDWNTLSCPKLAVGTQSGFRLLYS